MCIIDEVCRWWPNAQPPSKYQRRIKSHCSCNKYGSLQYVFITDCL